VEPRGDDGSRDAAQNQGESERVDDVRQKATVHELVDRLEHQPAAGGIGSEEPSQTTLTQVLE
jgi:hypothetical protein